MLSLSGSNVRLRYTGIILFLSRLFSLLTGAVFVLLITRKLPIEDFGLWSMIGRYLGYVLILTTVYSYWLPRTMARGINTSKTGLVFSFILGSTATLFYVIIAFWFSSAFDQSLLILLLVAPEVILSYIQSTMESVSTGYAPQLIGFAQIIFELVKVGLAFCLVFFFRVELTGAVLAVVGAQLVSVLFLTALNFKVINSSKLNLDIAKSWLKHSWLPLFSAGVGIVGGLDIILVRLISGSELPIAYYGIAFTIAGVVMNTNVLASGLYPRLLAKAHLSETEVVMKLMYMFAIPMSVFIFFYAEPISAVFGLKYLVATNIVRVAALSSLISIFSLLLDTVIVGIERGDAERLNSKDLVSSMLFKLPLLNCVMSFAYLIILYVLLIGAQGYVDVSFKWVVSSIISILLSIVVKLVVLRRDFRIKISIYTITSLLRYLAVSLFAVGFALSIWKVLPVEGIMNLFLGLVPPSMFTATVYFILLAIVDRDFKILMKAAVNEIKSILKRG